MTQMLETRLSLLREEIKRSKLSAIILQTPVSSLYISGFPCSNSLILVSSNQAIFFTDFRYIVKAQREINHLEVRQVQQQMVSDVSAVIKKLRLKRVGFEESVSYASYQALAQSLAGSAELISAGNIVRTMRSIKHPKEISRIASNQKLNQEIFKSAASGVREGMTEIDVRNHILRDMIDAGCEEAFSSIIASGPNSAYPHAVPTSAKVRSNNLLLFDMGVKKNFYHSDMTRTVPVGEKVSSKAKAIYEVVLAAQLAALNMVGPGVPCNAVDAAARSLIADAGYGDYFGHGLGHGVGLEIHEGPTLNAKSQDVLQPGMVITIEPGIYLPGVGGVRIEDLIVVTENGYKNLTSIPKALSFIQ